MTSQAETIPVERKRSRAMRRFLRHRPATVSLVVLGVVVLIALLAPPFIQDPNRVDLSSIKVPPTADHWLGADQAGRDVLSRVIHGLRTSLAVGIGAAALFVSIGAIIGLVAG